MVRAGGLLTVINSRVDRVHSKGRSENNIYSLCSRFPDGIEMVHDGEIRVYLMDG